LCQHKPSGKWNFGAIAGSFKTLKERAISSPIRNVKLIQDFRLIVVDKQIMSNYSVEHEICCEWALSMLGIVLEIIKSK
jgi:hypothetical protein